MDRTETMRQALLDTLREVEAASRHPVYQLEDGHPELQDVVVHLRGSADGMRKAIAIGLDWLDSDEPRQMDEAGWDLTERMFLENRARLRESLWRLDEIYGRPSEKEIN